MKRLIICLTLALGACSLPPQERAAIVPPVVASPAAVMEAPVVMPCDVNELAAHDGIGGTGCR